MKDSLRFDNKVAWKKFDAMGTLVDEGESHNQVQLRTLEWVIDWLDPSPTSSSSAITYMAVGTGTGQSVTDVALASQVSIEILATSVQPTAYSMACVATFTAITGTVEEAGLFPNSDGLSNMMFYNTADLSVALTSSDTLQITWTISCATCP